MRLFLTTILLLVISVSLFAQGFKYRYAEGPFNDNYKKRAKELLTETKYTDTFEILHDINYISFIGDCNSAYDICKRIRKYTVDEAFLKQLDMHEYTALIRVLVENEIITSINQIPLKSFNLYDAEEEINFQNDMNNHIQSLKDTFSKNKDNPDKEKSNEEEDIVTHSYNVSESNGTTIVSYSRFTPDDTEPLSEESLARQVLELQTAPTPYQNKIKFLSRIATYALIDKYPHSAERFAYDYINKYGYDQLTSLVVFYLIEKKEAKKANNLLDYVINISGDRISLLSARDMRRLLKLKALSLAMSGDLESGVTIINDIYDDLKGLPERIRILKLKLYLYSQTGFDKTNPDDVKKLENELMILHKEDQELLSKAFAAEGNTYPKYDLNLQSVKEDKANLMVFDEYSAFISVADLVINEQNLEL